MSIKSEVIDGSSNKTVIVIDRSKKFCQKVQGVTRLFQSPEDENQSDHLTKWSVSIQALLEFQRVIADIYPQGTKQFRICVSDTAARFITAPWREQLITYDEIIKALLENQPDPRSATKSSILTGLNISMDALCTPTSIQKKFMKMSAESYKLPSNFNGTPMPKKCMNVDEKRKKFYERLEKVRPSVQKNAFCSQRQLINNSGTIIVFTSIDDIKQLEEIVDFVEDQVYERNELYKTIGQTDSMLPISQIRLIIVHVSGENEQVSHEFMTDCYRAATRRGLVNAIVYFANDTKSSIKVVHQILCNDYEISSTTVSNIPMKEESDPKRSLNYNVEVLHHRRTHTFFQKHGLLELDSPIASRVDCLYTTAKLKWSNVNNKFIASEPPLFTFSSLATLSNVRDRPSACLSSFLMNKKTVLLDVNSYKELPMITKNFANTTISHLFTANINNGAMSIKSMSFDLAGSYNLLSKQKFTDADINSYKNLLILRKIEPNPIGPILIDQNPRTFFAPQKNEQLSVPERPIRSESPIAPKRQKLAHNWVTNQTINLHDFFSQRDEKCWMEWRDFEGRRLSEDKPVVLYPNLIITDRPEPAPGVRPNRPRPPRK